MHKVSIIILSYNTLTMTKECIKSIRRYTPAGSYEIIVIDNASTDNSVTWLKKQQDIKLLANTENKGFPGGCNQGMAMAEAGNDILLLNSDTIVTPRWLENLSTALYSSDDVGAVSCVTSSCSYGQQIDVAYKDYAELMDFAEQYNHSNPALWEQRSKLIGFCYLIKNSVFQALGGLDEQFSPGNFEDDDYSVRITLLGKKLLLCRDTFIHHYGSASFGKHTSPEEQAEKARYNALIQRNLKLFMEKWHVTAEYGNMHNVVFDVQEPQTATLRILVVGCNAGMDLCYLHNMYPNAIIHGIATNAMEARLAGQFFSVAYCDDIENDIFDVLQEKYDYILLTGDESCYTNLEHYANRLLCYLNSEGSIHISTQG